MDIFKVSVPLAAGVISAAALTNKVKYGMDCGYLLAGISTPLLFCIAAGSGICSKSGKTDIPALRSPIFWYSVFFILGISCYSSSFVTLPWHRGTRFFSISFGKMANVISRIPFSDTQNNMLAGALVIGDKTGLSKDIVQAFRNAGAAHLLALSGMHLGIIYLILSRTLSLISNTPTARKCRNVAIIAITGIYTLMCGAGASLVRAWLFIFINETSKLCGRPQPPGQVFCVALTIHLIVKPECISEIGFQLSYLAMVGIVFIWPKMRSWWDAWNDDDNEKASSPGRKIWDAASLSISCQLFTAPMTLYYFGTFPKFFLITNLVAAPLMSIVMLSSLVAISATAIGVEFRWLYLLCEAPLVLLRSLICSISSI